MRLLALFILLITLISCGKTTTGGSSSSDQGPEEQFENEGCTLDGCNTVTADGSSVDLLDSVIDAPVMISGSEIAFQEAKSSVAEGDKISCKTAVSAGEVYRYTLAGKKLTIHSAGGNFTMSRLNDDEDGLIGTWMWRGRGDMGMDVIRTMSVVTKTRVILKTHCEL